MFDEEGFWRHRVEYDGVWHAATERDFNAAYYRWRTRCGLYVPNGSEYAEKHVVTCLGCLDAS